jgi:hypothetical protein
VSHALQVLVDTSGCGFEESQSKVADALQARLGLQQLGI